MSSYADFSQQLKQAGIALTSAELHGFLCGLLCGGNHDASWQPLLFQFTNDNHAYPTALLSQVTHLQQQAQHTLSDVEGFNFALWLPDEEASVFDRADALSEWTNHFLLGLGLAQPTLDKEMGEIGEALSDLHEIAQLGYDEQDDPEELAEAVEEIVEYVRTLACILFVHFQPSDSPKTPPVLH